MFSVSKEQKLQVDICNLGTFFTVMDTCEATEEELIHALQSHTYD